MAANKSTARVGSTVKISSAMVSRGVRAFRASGVLDYESPLDALIVRQILDAALAVREVGKENSAKPRKAQRTRS